MFYQLTLIYADITLQTIHAGVTHLKIYFSFDEISMIFTSYFKYFLTHKLQLQPSNNEVKVTKNTTHHFLFFTEPFITPHSTVWLLVSLIDGMQIWFKPVTLQILILSMLHAEIYSRMYYYSALKCCSLLPLAY
jgi:hypothetical protein